MKRIFLLIAAFILSFHSFALTPIIGSLGVCVGSTSTLTDSTYGGTWASSNTLVATISGSMYATVTGVAPGTSLISYTEGGVTVTAVFVVYPAPAAITGLSSVCVGGTTTATDATSGGTWISLNPTIASIVSGTGVVTGVGFGVTQFEYEMGGSCYAISAPDTVHGIRVDSVSGASSVCAGSTITLTTSVMSYDYSYTGSWTSSNTAIATVSGGVVTGVAAGTATIMYSVTGVPCGTSSGTKVVTVVTTGTAGTISGASSVAEASSIALSETVTGGTWSSSNTLVATVSGSGVVTGVAPGTATISYGITDCSGTLIYATHVVTVTSVDEISGIIVFPSGYSGNVKVWLITYDPGTMMLEAQDSTVVLVSGDSVGYQFFNPGTDSFRIKAAIDSVGYYGITGYIPTYHTSNFYWYSATVLYHTSGTISSGQNIVMNTGTVTAGPGFIAGNVTTGANRGTSGTAPAAGLLIVAESAGVPVQQTYTDASGNYSFSNLPLGTYTVHGELLNYLSTDITGITLTASAPRATGNNLTQHTKSHTITPGDAAVTKVNGVGTTLQAFPNPTTGKLTIEWNMATSETGTLTISDITGRELSATPLQMNQGSGATQINMSDLSNGLYIISVKAGDLNYISKIQVQH